MTDAALHPAFVQGPRGSNFVLLRKPSDGAPGKCIMVVPPFAEEMNKTRPMLTMVARELAGAGIATLLPDLSGTGDSDGEFADGDWQVWQDDLLLAAEWAQQQGCHVNGLLAIRLGCILAAQFAARAPQPMERVVFWQPVVDGAKFTTQFLRLKVAASMMSENRVSVGELRAQLASGASIEVAGYELSHRLLSQIDGESLAPGLTTALGSVRWLEVTREHAELPATTREAIGHGRAAGCDVSPQTVAGEPFWSATEIVIIPELVQRTVEAFTGASR